MKTIELLHNDDEVLDPLDTHLKTRGSVLVDGSPVGGWAEHDDGTWKAWVRKPRFEVTAASAEALKRELAERV
ncbi:hypothetical protein [Paraburkholderia sp. DHOC27]|uniref:hypothetical protein n=1 Tax=Paraburkholderia sp. DHOC27 TaxID=2303330 RepID=UPI000E3E4373|nr:hypothetical protein [Paraburkholderia sp. DHOC27]RFU44992.1 hypothetical protein D0B32_24905 [Paraburkholderia sp. DHOC27]